MKSRFKTKKLLLLGILLFGLSVATWAQKVSLILEDFYNHFISKQF